MRQEFTQGLKGLKLSFFVFAQMLSKSYLFWGLKVVAPEMKEKALPEHHAMAVP